MNQIEDIHNQNMELIFMELFYPQEKNVWMNQKKY